MLLKLTEGAWRAGGSLCLSCFCSSSSESIETESALEETESTSTEIYYNETLKSNITNLGNEQIETVLPTEVTELDKIIKASKLNLSKIVVLSFHFLFHSNCFSN